VTFLPDEPIQTVVFAGSPREIQFIITKPLHWTQRRPTEDEQFELHKKHPNVPSDWIFLTIECKWNYELITTLFSFGERIMVLSPEKVVNDIVTKLTKMMGIYRTL
jgi:predicted DNA-binding transcriptional regulator YafY